MVVDNLWGLVAAGGVAYAIGYIRGYLAARRRYGVEVKKGWW